MAEKSSSYSELMEEVTSVWEEYSDQMDDQLQKLFDRNKEVYEDLYEEWQDYQDKMLSEIKDVRGEETQASMREMFEDWVYLSRQFQAMMEDIPGDEGIPDDLEELYTDYMGEIRDLLGEAMSTTLMKRWKEQEELYSLWVDTWSGLSEKEETDMTELFVPFQKQWAETSKQMMDMMMKALKEGDTDNIYEKMQKEWTKALSESTKEVMNSHPYAALQGTYVDNVLDTNITMKEMMQSYQKMAGMPTRDDMLKIYESMHELTSRVRKLERQLDNIPDDHKD